MKVLTLRQEFLTIFINFMNRANVKPTSFLFLICFELTSQERMFQQNRYIGVVELFSTKWNYPTQYGANTMVYSWICYGTVAGTLQSPDLLAPNRLMESLLSPHFSIDWKLADEVNESKSVIGRWNGANT